MISSVIDFWFLAIGAPILLFSLLVILFSKLRNIPQVGDYFAEEEERLAQAKNRSTLLYYLLAPVRIFLTLLVYAIPGLWLYASFSSAYSIDIIQKETLPAKVAASPFKKTDGFIFASESYLGLAKWLPELGIGEPLQNYLGKHAENSFALDSVAKGLARYDNDNHLNLVLNATDQPIYVTRHYFGALSKETEYPQIIPAYSFLGLRDGIGHHLYLGCQAKLPKELGIETTKNVKERFITQLLEQSEEKCFNNLKQS